MRKIYEKPELKAIEIKAELVLLTVSAPQGNGRLGDEGNPTDWD